MLPVELRAELDAELDALARLEGVEGVAPGFLRFCEAVARSQVAARATIRSAQPAGCAGWADISENARRLRRDSVVFREPALRDLFGALECWTGTASQAAKQLRNLGNTVDSEPVGLPELAAACAFDDHDVIETLAHKTGLSPPALCLVGRILAAPFMTEARCQRGPMPELDARACETPDAGRCPTCGSAPVLAVLTRNDGRRRLLCGLCGDSWIGPRLMCVACGTRDQAQLITLSTHEHNPYWVEACDACRRYLKTIDEGLLVDGVLSTLRAEEAVSLYLDLLAENAGYLRPDHHPLTHLEITS